MGYVEKSILPNEEIIEKAKIDLLHALFYGGIAVLLGLWWMRFHVGFAISVIIIFFPMLYLPKYIRARNTELAITNKKVFGKTGIFSTKTMDTPLNKINNVSVSRKLLGNILHYSSMDISSSSGSYVFHYVKDADQFKATLMQQIEIFEKDRISISNVNS